MFVLRPKLSLLKLGELGGDVNTGREENRGKGLRKLQGVTFRGDLLTIKWQVQQEAHWAARLRETLMLWGVHWAAQLREILMKHNILSQITSLAETSRQTSSR